MTKAESKELKALKNIALHFLSGTKSQERSQHNLKKKKSREFEGAGELKLRRSVFTQPLTGPAPFGEA